MRKRRKRVTAEQIEKMRADGDHVITKERAEQPAPKQPEVVAPAPRTPTGPTAQTVEMLLQNQRDMMSDFKDVLAELTKSRQPREIRFDVVRDQETMLATHVIAKMRR